MVNQYNNNTMISVSKDGHRDYLDSGLKDRSNALKALKKMKMLEAEKIASGKLKTFRMDDKTVVAATEKRMREIIEDYHKNRHILRGCALKQSKSI